MKRILLPSTLLAVLLAFALTSCGTKSTKTKTLVLYYSQTGATKQIAQEFANQLSADIIAIDVTEPYDGTYEETITRCQREMDADHVAPLQTIDTDLNIYDTIFLGYPIWFGNYARPIMALVEDYEFAGKTIIPFCTFGSGGQEPAEANLIDALPDANIITPGYGVREERVGRAASEIATFLKVNGFLPGEALVLPEYSDEEPVGVEDMELFQAACGNYRMPLGTPYAVARRTTPDGGTDYKFSVNGFGPDGREMNSTIYITKNGDDIDFIRVVREES